MKRRKHLGIISAVMLTMVMSPALIVEADDLTAVETTVLELTDIFETQNEIDEALQQEAQSGYSLEEALVVTDPYGTSPLSAVIIFSTETELGGTITVKGKSEENDIKGTFAAEKNHVVPVYGLYNADTTTVEIVLEDGTAAEFEITTEAIPTDYGTITAEMTDDKQYDYSKLTFVCSTMGSLYGLDAAGDIRFYTTVGGVLGVHQLENGHLCMPASYVLKTSYYKEGMIEIDLNGKIFKEYAIPGGQHHDFCELSNGNLLVASDSPDFSSVEDYIVELDRETGEVVWELDMKEMLPVEDGQSASMESDGSAEADWFHNNGLCYDEEQDLLLLSARHKDAIVAVKKEEKTLAWILGDPEGWEEVSREYFFTPEGEEFEWFYAQHHVSLLENGDICLFDNGTAKVKRVNNDARVTGDEVYSRAVVYSIDTENMTVSQVTEYGKERGSDWYADWISGVESLDGTSDHLWITAGSHLHNEKENRSDYYPSDMFLEGLTKTTHIDQVDNGALTYELTISGEGADALTFRSFRMNPYGETTKADIYTEPELLGGLGETGYDTQLPDGVESGEVQAFAEDMVVTLECSKIKLEVTGNYHTETKATDIPDAKMVLCADDEIRVYDMTQNMTESEENTNVSVKGWISTDGLNEKTWEICFIFDGTLYQSGYSIDTEDAE